MNRNFIRDIPPLKPSSSAWNVLSNVAATRTCGQINDAGQTTNRRHRPANVNPVSCVDIVKRMLKPMPKSCAYHSSDETMAYRLYAGLAPTFAMMTMTVCSLMLNGPGLRLISHPPSQRGTVHDRIGTIQAKNLPNGYEAT